MMKYNAKAVREKRQYWAFQCHCLENEEPVNVKRLRKAKRQSAFYRLLERAHAEAKPKRSHEIDA